MTTGHPLDKPGAAGRERRGGRPTLALKAMTDNDLIKLNLVLDCRTDHQSWAGGARVHRKYAGDPADSRDPLAARDATRRRGAGHPLSDAIDAQRVAPHDDSCQ